MSEITVLGAEGFIGSRIITRLREQERSVSIVRRDEDVSNRNLGHVIYCIGVTADFRRRPIDTVEAHVCKLLQILRSAQFDSFLYLSSTRLYGSYGSGLEDERLNLSPAVSDDLYNLSKAMGESVGLAGSPKFKVARLSNVYGEAGSDNFLASVIREAVTQKRIVLQTSLASTKDYIHIDEVVELLIRILTSGKQRIYNVASGFNITNEQIVTSLSKLTGCTVEVADGAPTSTFPVINVERIRSEFSFQPGSVLDRLDELVQQLVSAGGISDLN